MQRSGLFKEYELHIATVVYYPCAGAVAAREERAAPGHSMCVQFAMIGPANSSRTFENIPWTRSSKSLP